MTIVHSPVLRRQGAVRTLTVVTILPQPGPCSNRFCNRDRNRPTRQVFVLHRDSRAPARPYTSSDVRGCRTMTGLADAPVGVGTACRGTDQTSHHLRTSPSTVWGYTLHVLWLTVGSVPTVWGRIVFKRMFER